VILSVVHYPVTCLASAGIPYDIRELSKFSRIPAQLAYYPALAFVTELKTYYSFSKHRRLLF
jgi:hypothetical protein